MVRSRALEPPRVSPLAPQASASTNSATTACGEECRETRLQATAQHVTNRMCADKGGLSGGPFHGFTGLLVTPPSRPSRQSRAMPAKYSAASPHVGAARQHLLQLDCNAVAAHHHGARGDRHVVGEYPDLVVLARVELDDGAAAELEHLVHRHGRRAEHDRDIERDLVDCGHGRVLLDGCRGHDTGW